MDDATQRKILTDVVIPQLWKFQTSHDFQLAVISLTPDKTITSTNTTSILLWLIMLYWNMRSTRSEEVPPELQRVMPHPRQCREWLGAQKRFLQEENHAEHLNSLQRTILKEVPWIFETTISCEEDKMPEKEAPGGVPQPEGVVVVVSLEELLQKGDALDQNWAKKYLLLKQYLQEHNQKFPSVHQVYRDVNIGSWVHNQKTAEAAGKMKPYRQQFLQQLNFPFRKKLTTTGSPKSTTTTTTTTNSTTIATTTEDWRNHPELLAMEQRILDGADNEFMGNLYLKVLQRKDNNLDPQTNHEKILDAHQLRIVGKLEKEICQRGKQEWLRKHGIVTADQEPTDSSHHHHPPTDTDIVMNATDVLPMMDDSDEEMGASNEKEIRQRATIVLPKHLRYGRDCFPFTWKLSIQEIVHDINIRSNSEDTVKMTVEEIRENLKFTFTAPKSLLEEILDRIKDKAPSELRATNCALVHVHGREELLQMEGKMGAKCVAIDYKVGAKTHRAVVLTPSVSNDGTMGQLGTKLRGKSNGGSVLCLKIDGYETTEKRSVVSLIQKAGSEPYKVLLKIPPVQRKESKKRKKLMLSGMNSMDSAVALAGKESKKRKNPILLRTNSTDSTGASSGKMVAKTKFLSKRPSFSEDELLESFRKKNRKEATAKPQSEGFGPPKLTLSVKPTPTTLSFSSLLDKMSAKPKHTETLASQPPSPRSQDPPLDGIMTENPLLLGRIPRKRTLGTTETSLLQLDSFGVTFETTKPLGFYCVDQKENGVNWCKIISIDGNGQCIRDSRIKVGSVVEKIQLQGKDEVEIRSWKDLKRACEGDLPITLTFLPLFVHETKKVGNWSSIEWDGGLYRGNCSSGWDGGAEVYAAALKQKKLLEAEAAIAQKARSDLSVQTPRNGLSTEEEFPHGWKLVEKKKSYTKSKIGSSGLKSSIESARKKERKKVSFREVLHEERRYVKNSLAREMYERDDTFNLGVPLSTRPSFDQVEELLLKGSFSDVYQCLTSGVGENVESLEYQRVLKEGEELLKIEQKRVEDLSSTGGLRQKVTLKTKLTKLFLLANTIARNCRYVRHWFQLHVEIQGMHDFLIDNIPTEGHFITFRISVTYADTGKPEPEERDLPEPTRQAYRSKFRYPAGVKASYPISFNPQIANKRFLTFEIYLESKHPSENRLIMDRVGQVVLTGEQVFRKCMKQSNFNDSEVGKDMQNRNSMPMKVEGRNVRSGYLDLLVHATREEAGSSHEKKAAKGLANLIKDIDQFSEETAGQDVDVTADFPTSSNLTLLHSAVFLENVDLVRRLLLRGGDPNYRSKCGTPKVTAMKLKESLEEKTTQHKSSGAVKIRLKKLEEIIKLMNERANESSLKDQPDQTINRAKSLQETAVDLLTAENALMTTETEGDPELIRPSEKDFLRAVQLMAFESHEGISEDLVDLVCRNYPSVEYSEAAIRQKLNEELCPSHLLCENLRAGSGCVSIHIPFLLLDGVSWVYDGLEIGKYIQDNDPTLVRLKNSFHISRQSNGTFFGFCLSLDKPLDRFFCVADCARNSSWIPEYELESDARASLLKSIKTFLFMKNKEHLVKVLANFLHSNFDEGIRRAPALMRHILAQLDDD